MNTEEIKHVRDLVLADMLNGNDKVINECILRKLDEQLTIQVVSITLPSIDSIEFIDWLKSEGYKTTLNSYLYLKNNSEYDKDILYKYYCNLLEFGN